MCLAVFSNSYLTKEMIAFYFAIANLRAVIQSRYVLNQCIGFTKK